ncbi:50S ribosomal protein L25/general stress protein Ctc [Zavarzinia compransoris]|uniref:50S ribosomal protein L25/general stress protein Ctc n=1 Tax=Zavarzinia marina TaxID=2911065 RepID=UPI001F1DDBDA|nr:50S ribosomal protein L25/general stress protein Ctc [Zavarzinia marina]MCF4164865.1 50S ribosomal protein L25/general stress protein Ctc [Zavarzinia marina]
MSKIVSLAVEARDRVGKGSARGARREGRVPAVIYGNKEAPEGITISWKELEKELNSGRFLSTVFDLKIGERSERVLPRDVQFHPVTDRALHVDFLRIPADGLVTVTVPVIITDHAASPGLKLGGVLNVVRHEVELMCPADAVPEQITISLAGMNFGESLHISKVALPEGAKPVIDRDFTIFTIVPPKGGVETAAPAEAAPAKKAKK